MQRASWASNGPNHLGSCVLQPPLSEKQKITFGHRLGVQHGVGGCTCIGAEAAASGGFDGQVATLPLPFLLRVALPRPAVPLLMLAVLAFWSCSLWHHRSGIIALTSSL